jgi:AAA domain
MSPTDRRQAIVMPVPKSAPPVPQAHPKLGAPSARWTYRDAEGRTLFHVWRFDHPETGKEYRPLTLWKEAQERLTWNFLAPPAPRPLYGLDEIARWPGELVLVVEGEKTAEAANQMFPFHVVTTSMGGAQGAAHADWSPLQGRKIVIWPDADEAGASYAAAVTGALKGIAASVRIVSLDASYPKGWDLADRLDFSRPQPEGLDEEGLERAIKEACAPAPPVVAKTAMPAGAASNAVYDEADGISGAELEVKEFPPIQWIVPEFIVEGLTLVAGKPKLGKSWVALNLGVAVAAGGRAFSSVACEAGDVLALCLEDNQRRLASRMRQLMANAPWPARIQFHTTWPRLDEGGLERMADWIAKARRPRLILIDVWTKVRGRPDAKQSLYADDFASLSALQMLASKHRIAIIAIHHTSKRENPEDPFDLVSGTTGLTGAADSIVILRKEAGQADAMLYGRGRDLHVFEKAMAFDQARGLWSVLGDAEAYRASTAEAKILEALANAGEAVTPRDVAALVEQNYETTKHRLYRLANKGAIKKAERGKFVIV